MRAIDLIVNENGKICNYSFLRIEGMDDEIATYELVLNLGGGFKLITEFKGTMEQNAHKLSLYFHDQKNVEILKISGDTDLKRAFQFSQMNL